MGREREGREGGRLLSIEVGESDVVFCQTGWWITILLMSLNSFQSLSLRKGEGGWALFRRFPHLTPQ